MESRSIKIWLGEISNYEEEYPLHWSILDVNEKQQASNFKNEHFRLRYVAIHAKLRTLLAQAVDTNPEELRIEIAQHGKPYLTDYPDVSFNLSHTANTMAVAITSHCVLGIDIEICKPRANLSALVEKCFGEEEKRFWYQLPENQKTQEFYRFWTRKEAFVKATGRGIALGLKQCVINPIRPTEFLNIPEEFGLSAEWWIHDIENGKDTTIVGALAIKSDVILPIEQIYFA